MTRALILGIGGQDGSYLADILLEQGAEVAGLHRHSSYDNLGRVRHLLRSGPVARDEVRLYRGDLLDVGSIRRAVEAFRPDEIYNVADQDNVGWSREAPAYQKMVTADAVYSLGYWLLNGYEHERVRLFQPLSCTVFADAPPPQSETAPTSPARTTSPYARCKLEAWGHCRALRTDGLFVSCGIMFNHDSPRRAPGYLLQDVCRQAVAVARGRAEAVVVGPLDQRVDVGYAREYMEAAVAMLRRPAPGDWCVGTGVAWTVGLMVERALIKTVGLARYAEEKGKLIRVDPDRKAGPEYRADLTKTRAELGWAPRTDVGALIDMLVDHFRSQP